MADKNDILIEKIEHILSIYPVISHTMLQAALGPQIPVNKWRPLLDALIEQGKIKQESETKKSPSGRNITYTKLSLTD